MEVDAVLWMLLAATVAFVICGCILTGRTRLRGLRDLGQNGVLGRH